MSYYEDEEDYKSSVKFYGFVFKIALNIATLIVLYKLLYFPNFPEELKNSAALYVMPIIGTIGAYCYLSYWFGWKNSLNIVGVAGFSIGLVALTSFQTLTTLYGIGLLIAFGYGGYLLIKMGVQDFLKKTDNKQLAISLMKKSHFLASQIFIAFKFFIISFNIDPAI